MLLGLELLRADVEAPSDNDDAALHLGVTIGSIGSNGSAAGESDRDNRNGSVRISIRNRLY